MQLRIKRATPNTRFYGYGLYTEILADSNQVHRTKWLDDSSAPDALRQYLSVHSPTLARIKIDVDYQSPVTLEITKEVYQSIGPVIYYPYSSSIVKQASRLAIQNKEHPRALLLLKHFLLEGMAVERRENRRFFFAEFFELAANAKQAISVVQPTLN